VGKLDLRHRCEPRVLVREAPKGQLELFYEPIDLIQTMLLLLYLKKKRKKQNSTNLIVNVSEVADDQRK
jgi:hypothetical protein